MQTTEEPDEASKTAATIAADVTFHIVQDPANLFVFRQ